MFDRKQTRKTNQRICRAPRPLPSYAPLCARTPHPSLPPSVSCTRPRDCNGDCYCATQCMATDSVQHSSPALHNTCFSSSCLSNQSPTMPRTHCSTSFEQLAWWKEPLKCFYVRQEPSHAISPLPAATAFSTSTTFATAMILAAGAPAVALALHKLEVDL